MKKILRCETDGCSNEIGERSITGLCKQCYAYLYNMQKHDNHYLVKRAMQIRLWENRLNFLLPRNKVRVIGSKKPRQLAVLPRQVKQYRKRTKYKVVKKSA